MFVVLWAMIKPLIWRGQMIFHWYLGPFAAAFDKVLLDLLSIINLCKFQRSQLIQISIFQTITIN